jgi:hypothetical protein
MTDLYLLLIIVITIVIFMGIVLVYLLNKFNKQEKLVNIMFRDYQHLNSNIQYYSNLPQTIRSLIDTRLNHFDEYLKMRLSQSLSSSSTQEVDPSSSPPSHSTQEEQVDPSSSPPSSSVQEEQVDSSSPSPPPLHSTQEEQVDSSSPSPPPSHSTQEEQVDPSSSPPPPPLPPHSTQEVDPSSPSPPPSSEEDSIPALERVYTLSIPNEQMNPFATLSDIQGEQIYTIREIEMPSCFIVPERIRY